MRHLIRPLFAVTLCVFMTGLATAAIPQSERDALIALYNSTGGDFWDNNGGWLGPPTTECTWHGVVCDPGENNVEELHLAGNHLVGPLPAEIDDLTMLRVMVFAFNAINGLPPELFTMSQLENIEMAANPLTGPIPPEIGNLANLHNLDFNWNQFTGPLPPELGNLANLHALRLGDNRLEGPVPPEIGNMGELRELDLWGNQFTGQLPPELGNLANLIVFSIDRNQLSGFLPPELGNLTNLNWLNLESNDFTGAIPPELGSLANLGSLRLNHNHLSGPIPPEFGNLGNLVEVFLEDNMLSGPIPPELGNLASLERLSASFNALEGSLPPELGNLANLRSLFLERNHLSGPIPPELGNLANLEELHLSANVIVGPIPPEITLLGALWDDGSRIDFNGVHTGDPGVGGFMDAKFGGGWRDTQTVAPASVWVDFTSGIAAGLGWDPILYQWNQGGYEIMVASDIGGPYDPLAYAPGKHAGWWAVFDLEPNTQYFFKLRTVTHPCHDNRNTVMSEFTPPVDVLTPDIPSTLYVATTGAPGNDCVTPATACPNIQMAVDMAGPGEQIMVAAGVYPGRTTVDRPLKISGDSPSTTILDGQGADTVFWVTGGTPVRITDVTIQNGQILFGAGLYAQQFATLEIMNSVFTDNHAMIQGGGLYLEWGGRMLLDRVQFTNNTAGERGGGLFTLWDSHVAVMDSMFSGNSAPWGGGYNSVGVTYIERSTFDGNTATDFGGGGILNQGWLVISDSAVTNNTAAHGAGIAGMGGGNMTIGNTTISGNSGGGLFNCEHCWARIESSTIVHNSAPFTEHSGIMNWSELYLHNTIVAANSPFNCANPITSLGFNLDDDDTCGLTMVGDQSNVDPLLGPLADNGGPTMTHEILVGSPAIDAGDPLEFPATDQRGYERPYDGDFDGEPLPDIGAFENNAYIFVDGFESGDLTIWSSSVP